MTAATPATLELTGASGRRYTFYVFDWGTTFKPAGGLYAVSRATPKPDGANRLCASVQENEEARLAAERDVIAGYNPLCNG